MFSTSDDPSVWVFVDPGHVDDGPGLVSIPGRESTMTGAVYAGGVVVVVGGVSYLRVLRDSS